MNIYESEFFCICPNNNIRVKYQLEIKTNKTIPVEEIIHEVQNIHRGFHEKIADQLFCRFGGEQKLSADHHSVKITTIRT